MDLSLVDGKSLYAFMDYTSISENVFMDTEEPQVQTKNSAAATISRPHFDWDNLRGKTSAMGDFLETIRHIRQNCV